MFDISIIKVGTSSLTNDDGSINKTSIENIVNQIVFMISKKHKVVLVASGAVAVGINRLKNNINTSKRDSIEYRKLLPAAAGIGQPILYNVFDQLFKKNNINCAQILLTADTMFDRKEYLHFRSTLETMLQNDIVPIINENDCITSSDLRYGNNDLIAALTGHMIFAKKLLLLTDVNGLYSGNPINIDSQLIQKIDFITDEVLALVDNGSNSNRGSGGMGGKLLAAKIASWSNIETIIAGANEENIIVRALSGEAVGTKIIPKQQVLSRRKLWIGFVQPTKGQIIIDQGAEKAIMQGKSSLLTAGIRKIVGQISKGDGVEIVNLDGKIIAKGISNIEISEDESTWHVHKMSVKKDYLMILPNSQMGE